jgi:hypothetical protein
MFTTSALVLACGAFGAIAQDRMTPQPDQQHTQHHPTGQERSGTSAQADMMGSGMGPGMSAPGMMGLGMMGGGMMGGGAMGPPIMMRIIFSLMDSDGDGTISLQEFQAAHERIFKGMDSNKDGRLTQEEMQAFMQGTRRSTPQQ